MPSAMDQHHHRNTTKVGNKPYKSRFASKSALKDQSKGKVENFEKGSRKTPHQQVMSKLDRKNQSKQRRLHNHEEHARATNTFSGKNGAPRVVAVVPLCGDVTAADAILQLNTSLDIEDEFFQDSITRIRIDRFNQNIAYITVKKDLVLALDACRCADYVLFVLSASEAVDELGEAILQGVEWQGVSQVYTTVLGLDNIQPPKRRPQVMSSLKSFIVHFLPAQEKVFSLESRQECQNVIRSLCSTTPKGVRWREDRSWMLIEDAQWLAGDHGMDSVEPNSNEVIFTGVVRGKGMKADRLVQIGDWATFQISKITGSHQGDTRKSKQNGMVLNEEVQSAILEQPSGDQDDLDELAPEEVAMIDVDEASPDKTDTERRGVLIDQHREYVGPKDDNIANFPKKLPRGTSKYQAAWYLGDVSDSGSDMEDIEDDLGDLAMSDIPIGMDNASDTPHLDMEQIEAGPSEYPESEMFLDPSPDDEAELLAAHRAKRKVEEREDLEFPDEIELQPDVLARQRLARYRGLTSVRTSPWDTEGDKIYQPHDWERLLEISDYKSAKSKIMGEALVGGVKPGTRVHIHVKNVPSSFQQEVNLTRPLALFSLLRHEHKRTVVNFSITLKSNHPHPLKSKEELLMQCGSRRFVINPVFSQGGNSLNNVHKFQRYLHPGRTAVASFMAPITWGAAPALFFQRTKSDTNLSPNAKAMPVERIDGNLRIVGHGTALPSSTSRIIAKRIILTGQPYKIHRKLVTVRYMFFNAEDVAWFKALQLWTSRNRQGVMKESLGTHGYFKAVFDGKVGMQDAVGISLYKRVWPRPARHVKPAIDM